MVDPLGFELRTFGSEEVGNIDLKAYREYLDEKYGNTPISFTFTLLYIGVLIGLLLAYRVLRKMNGVK